MTVADNARADALLRSTLGSGIRSSVHIEAVSAGKPSLVSAPGRCYGPTRMRAGSDLGRGRRWRSAALSSSLSLVIWSGYSLAAASPVIPAGKEDVVMGLFAPHALGSEIEAGCVLRRVEIKPDHIVLTLLRGEESAAQLHMKGPADSPGPDDVPSFAIEYKAPDPSFDSCFKAVRDLVAKNDDGKFWDEHTVRPVVGGGGKRGGGDEDGEGQAFSGRLEADRILQFGVLAAILMVGVFLVTGRKKKKEPTS